MIKKFNQVQPEGIAQPKIELNSRWKDSRGEKITVTCVTDSRITYVRDGYSHECFFLSTGSEKNLFISLRKAGSGRRP